MIPGPGSLLTTWVPWGAHNRLAPMSGSTCRSTAVGRLERESDHLRGERPARSIGQAPVPTIFSPIALLSASPAVKMHCLPDGTPPGKMLSMRQAAILSAFAWASLLACGGSPRAAASSSSGTAGSGTGAVVTTTDDVICRPGDQRCSAGGDLETCDPTGRAWEITSCESFESCLPCSPEEDPTCETGAKCVGPCDAAEELPSSAGCTFFAARMLHVFEDQPSGLIVGNPSSTAIATVQLYDVPVGTRSEVANGTPVILQPGGTHVYSMTNASIDASQWTKFRTGGNVVLRSDVPVVAYLHSPLTNQTAIDMNAGGAPESSMLLPLSALRQEYVVASYPPFEDPAHPLGDGQPSYFTVIAVEDNTILEWTPPVDTAGSGLPVDQVKAGQTGTLLMNRFDMVRIAASGEGDVPINQRDVSGTIVRANHPIWVAGGVRCSYVPLDTRFCDHLQEVMFPVEFWGKTYVAAHAPTRGAESYHWRIYSGEDGVSITTDPVQSGTPAILDKGQFLSLDVPPETDFVVSADGPVLPVQYLEGNEGTGVGEGDPSMVQSVPVEQFLSRYTVVTSLNYPKHFAQVIRKAGSGDITVDGTIITGYRMVGEYEVADWPISEGSHLLESQDDFGVIQVGYGLNDPDNPLVKGEAASYAYPGGMKAETIFQP